MPPYSHPQKLKTMTLTAPFFFSPYRKEKIIGKKNEFLCMLSKFKSWQNLKLTFKSNNSNLLGSSYMQDRQYDIITNKMGNFMHIMFFTMRRKGFSTNATQ